MTRTQRIIPTLALLVSLSACATAATPSRAGEAVDKASLDAVSYGIPGRPSGDLLIDVSRALPSASKGSLELRLGPEPDSGLPDTSADALGAVRSGDVDVAVVSAPTLADAGVPALRAFQAPGLLASRAAVESALNDPVVGRALQPARALGLVPVGVSFDDFRYPAAWDKPLLSPDTWAGRTVATKPSAVLVALIEAMGAKADFRNGSDLASAVATKEVTGGFFAMGGPSNPAEGAVLTVNALQTVRVDVVVVNAKVYDGLSGQQREALASAVRTGARAQAPLKRAPLAEQAAAYCAQMSGGVVLESAEQLAASTRAASPVYRMLESDPETAQTIARFRTLAAAEPVEAPPAPCSATMVATDPAPLEPTGDQSVLNGVWRTTVRESVLAGAGWAPSDVANNTGVWTITFTDGHYKVIEPSGRGCSGRSVVAKDKLEMRETSPGCDGDWRLLFRRDGDSLELRGDHAAKPEEAAVYDVLWSAGLTRIADAP
ncbi:TRAP-type C4-dicarboxylate transport system substrate-binding protein [Humibacillus xanthopallidus]|uniref:TRAP-type C4-dicarboxylate transport system substrate-binding protein n=1 Tax=Humibacillus xanthopallidus TaxID=412689 RepID=A0A543PQV7_9MICO|nr:hypothetical protein [Humibacillus xanthopallidus]TQN46459.1 TRAP-type C4-dicarboxylate transport system substrate-binding protein [Humibacillus xanthopallidus]